MTEACEHNFARAADRKVNELASSPTSVDADDVSMSPKRLALALGRKPVIEHLLSLSRRTRADVLSAAEQLKCSPRTIWSLIRRYGANRRLSSLAPDVSTRRKGKSRIDPRVGSIITEVIGSYHLSRMRPTKTQTILEVRRRCAAACLPLPNPKTVRSRIALVTDFEVARAREGSKRAREKFGIISGSTPDTFLPLQRVQIDHTKVDLIVVDELTRMPLERPFITVAIDEYSRAILGFYLTLEAPSSTSVGLCLVQSILPKTDWAARIGLQIPWEMHGRPDELYTDNGADFRSEAMEMGCLAWGMKISFRPPGMPHFGGIVERVIGTAMRSLKTLPGATGGSVVHRGDRDPAKSAAMTMRELELYLATFFAGQYHHTIHSFHGMTPHARWKLGIFGDAERSGRGVPTAIDDPSRLLIDFLPLQRRSVTRRGIRWAGILYMDDVLRPYVESDARQSFVVRRDPRDVSWIWFLCPEDNRYYPIRSRDISRPSLTLWELENARKHLRRQGRIDYDETALFAAATAQREIVEEATLARAASRKGRLAVERRRQSNRSSLPSRPTDTPQGPTSVSPWRQTKPDDLDQDDVYEIDT